MTFGAVHDTLHPSGQCVFATTSLSCARSDTLASFQKQVDSVIDCLHILCHIPDHSQLVVNKCPVLYSVIGHAVLVSLPPNMKNPAWQLPVIVEGFINGDHVTTMWSCHNNDYFICPGTQRGFLSTLVTSSLHQRRIQQFKKGGFVYQSARWVRRILNVTTPTIAQPCAGYT